MDFPGSGQLNIMVSLFLYYILGLSETLHSPLFLNLHLVIIACTDTHNLPHLHYKLRILPESEP